MPLPLTVSCFSKIQIGFTFLVPAHLGSPGKGPLNGCVCVFSVWKGLVRSNVAPRYTGWIAYRRQKSSYTTGNNVPRSLYRGFTWALLHSLSCLAFSKNSKAYPPYAGAGAASLPPTETNHVTPQTYRMGQKWDHKLMTIIASILTD